MGFQRGQRKQVYVSPSIQGGIIGRFATFWVGYHMALWHGMLLYGFIRGNHLRAATGGGMSFWDYYVKFFEVNYSILLCAAAICPILLWDILRYTHRIAGPVVRFKKVLKQLTQGEPVAPIQLRENDLLDDLKVAFNEFLASREQSSHTASGHLSSTEIVSLEQILGRVPSEAESDEEPALGSRV